MKGLGLEWMGNEGGRTNASCRQPGVARLRHSQAVCVVHDVNVGGESPLSEVGEAEGPAEPKGATARCN